MTQRFFIPGPLPGMNDFAGKKSRWHYRQLKADWHATIALYIGMAKLRPMERAAITFTWQEKNKRRDPDNIITGQKFVLDALVSRGILANDGWDEIASLKHEFTVSPQQPGVMVEMIDGSEISLD